MTSNPLWRPSSEQIEQANLTRFMTMVRKEHNAPLSTYQDLYAFSISQPESFWKAVWSFCNIIAQTQGNRILIDADRMEAARIETYTRRESMNMCHSCNI